MSRPSELTRQNLIEHAVDSFAAYGFEGASVRTITQRANANQAAISYHFGSKEGLYREVLRTAIDALSESGSLKPETVDDFEPDEAVRLFVRQQLLPLQKNSRVGRYMQIFAWEGIAPTPVFQEYLLSEQIPALAIAERIVRRYAPASASREEIMIKTVWLSTQANTFVRHAATLGQPPLRLTLDPPSLERLIDLVSALATAALSGEQSKRGPVTRRQPSR